MNILTLKVGDKYNADYVNRLYKALKRNSTVDFNFYCYTEDSSNLLDDIIIIPLTIREDIVKQWYKIDFHNMPDIKGKCLILDIDYIILQNVDDILTWDLPENHFGCVWRWWVGESGTRKCKINGGFQMFYQGTTKHLYDRFYDDPLHYQEYYIKRRLAAPPVNGEQNFIDQYVDLERSWLPMEWFAKYDLADIVEVNTYWKEAIDPTDDYYHFDGNFDERIRMLHFAGSDNYIEGNDQWVERYWYD